MKKLLLIPVISMLVALGSIQPDVFAQTSQNSGEQQLYNAANGISNAPVDRPNTPSNTNNNNQPTLGSGVNWLWLLPLLAIPIIFLIFRWGESSENNQSYKSPYQLAGVRGGRSVRKRNKTSTKSKKANDKHLTVLNRKAE